MFDFIPLLDSQYPNSKFIHHYRDKESWIKSKVNHILCHNKDNPDNPRAIKTFEHYSEHFDEKTEKITSYFEGKDNFLTMKIIEGEGWEKLCPFLGLEIPDVEFPNVNKGTYL